MITGLAARGRGIDTRRKRPEQGISTSLTHETKRAERLLALRPHTAEFARQRPRQAAARFRHSPVCVRHPSSLRPTTQARIVACPQAKGTEQ